MLSHLAILREYPCWGALVWTQWKIQRAGCLWVPAKFPPVILTPKMVDVTNSPRHSGDLAPPRWQSVWLDASHTTFHVKKNVAKYTELKASIWAGEVAQWVVWQISECVSVIPAFP